MLQRLTIDDFALIASAQIEFSSGSTMFTGETGSGKTMVLGALGFALGDRAGGDVVRRGAKRAQVTLSFEPTPQMRGRFAQEGYAIDDDEFAILAREFADGKSAMRLNGRPTTAAYVREVADSIADVVGQHEAQRLLAPAFHSELLDRFGGEKTLGAREPVSAAYAHKTEIAELLDALERDERRAQEQAAFADFALAEIRAASPEAGEDERLEARRRVLDNAEKIAVALRGAHEALAGDDSSANDALGAAASSLQAIAAIDKPFNDMLLQIEALQSEISDVAAELTRHAEELEFDSAELETINARLDVLDRLKRKYGGSIDAVLGAETAFAQTIDLVANKDARRAQLQDELARAVSGLNEAAQRLSALRVAAGKKLERAVQSELADLALPNATFAVAFTTLREPGPSGAESVEFLFSANKGESAKRLAKAASGGELSRVLLALVVALAGARGSTAMIFDEVDAGIGGATAGAVGVRLARLAEAAQVICVTHLAQIASWAGTHYVLEKRETKNGTTIEVRALQSQGERTAEIARMLSGEPNEAALKHARTLLASAKL